MGDETGPGRGGARPGSGRKLTAPDSQKRRPRSVKMSDAEWAAIQEAARVAGLNVSEYIRAKAIPGRTRRRKPDQKPK